MGLNHATQRTMPNVSVQSWTIEPAKGERDPPLTPPKRGIVESAAEEGDDE